MLVLTSATHTFIRTLVFIVSLGVSFVLFVCLCVFVCQSLCCWPERIPLMLAFLFSGCRVTVRMLGSMFYFYYLCCVPVGMLTLLHINV